MIQPGARSARTATLRLALCLLAFLALLLVLQPVGAREVRWPDSEGGWMIWEMVLYV